jgi:hypothetical protein
MRLPPSPATYLARLYRDDLRLPLVALDSAGGAYPLAHQASLGRPEFRPVRISDQDREALPRIGLVQIQEGRLALGPSGVVGRHNRSAHGRDFASIGGGLLRSMLARSESRRGPQRDKQPGPPEGAFHGLNLPPTPYAMTAQGTRSMDDIRRIEAVYGVLASLSASQRCTLPGQLVGFSNSLSPTAGNWREFIKGVGDGR